MDELRRDFEVVVLGGGPAGVAAACVAAESGRSTALLEGTPWLGGPIWRAASPARRSRPARRWLDRLDRSGAVICCETTAIGEVEPGRLRAERGGMAVDIAWQRLVLATGCQELYLPFPGWTLPQVCGAGGLQLLAKTGWPLKGRRVLVAGTGPLLLAVAAYLVRAGVQVIEIAEQAAGGDVVRFAAGLPWRAPRKFLQAMGFQRSLWGVRYRTGCWPIAAQGDDRLRRVVLADGARTWTRECDYLACAFGLIPSLQWPRLLGCRVGENGVVVDRFQQTSVPAVYSAGEVAGITGVDGALIEGQIAGYAAAGREARARRLIAARDRSHRFARTMQATFALRDDVRSLATRETIICRCEDVTMGQLEEYTDLRSAKLMTRCGMGPCQGRVCQSALQAIKGWSSDSVRPPVQPARVRALTGVFESFPTNPRSQP